jgi:hypothetical protein
MFEDLCPCLNAVNILHVIVSIYTRKNVSCVQQVVFALGGLFQVVTKFGTSCFKTVVTTLLILSDLLQRCSNKSDTVMM